MGNSIFINYRRSLAVKDARLLQRALQRSLGAKRVFLDVDGVDGGDHWLHTLERQVDASAAMVVLIGEGWADTQNEKGERRLDNPNDFVRFEIARALARGIPVLPALIDRAAMPAVAELPQILVPLTFLQAMPLRMESFDDDVDRIARRLRFLITQARPRGVPMWQMGAVTAFAVVLGVTAGPPALTRLGVPLPFVDATSRTTDPMANRTFTQLIEGYERERAALAMAWMQVRTKLTEAEKRDPGSFTQLDRLLGRIYTSNLSFLDVDTKSVMGAGDAELINAAVEEGMKKLAAQDLKYAFNTPGFTLANNDSNAHKMSVIYWEPNLSKAEKVDKIIKDLMVPSGIDGLVFGQFQQKQDGSVNLRPIVISKATKNIVTESRSFKKEEFDCTDSKNPNKMILCQKAVEDIRDTIIRLLKTL